MGGGTNLLRGGAGRDTFHANLSGTATLIGDSDDDTFIVTNSAGLVSAPVGGITIDGGGQPGDTLRLVGGGGPSFNQTYIAGPGAGQGQIVTTNSYNPTGPTISQFVRFTGLASIDDSIAVNRFTVLGASPTAPLAGASARDLASGRLRLTVGGSPFAAITFANKTKPSVLLADGRVITPAQPAIADYDGDGVTDLAVFEPSTATFFLARSSLGNTTIQFGIGSRFGGAPIPVPGDYDGDGVTDLAVFEPATATFSLARSSLGNTAIQFGIGSRFGGAPIPVPPATTTATA